MKTQMVIEIIMRTAQLLLIFMMRSSHVVCTPFAAAIWYSMEKRGYVKSHAAPMTNSPTK